LRGDYLQSMYYRHPVPRDDLQKSKMQKIAAGESSNIPHKAKSEPHIHCSTLKHRLRTNALDTEHFKGASWKQGIDASPLWIETFNA